MVMGRAAKRGKLESTGSRQSCGWRDAEGRDSPVAGGTGSLESQNHHQGWKMLLRSSGPARPMAAIPPLCTVTLIYMQGFGHISTNEGGVRVDHEVTSC